MSSQKNVQKSLCFSHRAVSSQQCRAYSVSAVFTSDANRKKFIVAVYLSQHIYKICYFKNVIYIT